MGYYYPMWLSKKIVYVFFLIFILVSCSESNNGTFDSGSTENVIDLKESVVNLSSSPTVITATVQSELPSHTSVPIWTAQPTYTPVPTLTPPPPVTPVPPQTPTPTPLPTPTPVLSGQSFPSFLDNFSHLDGSSYLMAQDGEYIGEISSNQFDSESICNDFGKFGSEFSNTSIRNEFGPYGSEFRTYSAYNPFTSSPPLILFNDYRDGIHLGYLTKNDFLYESLDPDLLLLSLGCLD